MAILEGKIEPEQGSYRNGLISARERWNILKNRHALLAKLAKFELSPDQVERVANPDRRSESGIEASEDAIVQNPYILSECDLGTENSAPISLEAIDHGMKPEGDARLFMDGDEVPQDDRRRVRAVTQAVLREAADRGDTVLVLPDLLEGISKRFPERRSCRPDRDVLVAEQEFSNERLWTAFDSQPQLIAIKQLQFLEQTIATVVKRRVRRKNQLLNPPISWFSALETNFGNLGSKKEKAALIEKSQALEKLFLHRLSVLTGGAGTGKTSTLKVFLDELEKREGRNPVLLLAPTGKARVRLSTRTGRNAMTIHQFLLKQGWFRTGLFALKDDSDRDSYKATTVVIDECSMIPVDLFGTLLRALDMGPLTRLILVGDPNQLPPIGPGRPFIDIIEWLNKNYPDCIAPLNVCMRVDEDDPTESSNEESVALELANGFRADAANPGDDEILASVARGRSEGDLQVVFWEDYDELRAKLKQNMADFLGFKENDFKGFNRSLGIDVGDWKKSEAWQILSPTRTQYFGTDDLNRTIQFEYRGGLINRAQNRWNRTPLPFGDLDIVWNDKIIQIRNQSRKGWPRNTGLEYVVGTNLFGRIFSA
ncbi:MAG: AAA family ATPase [Chloroflexi bacterium]|nr:AAA family ATPase [Chloroflexota bacterium]